MEHLHGPIRSGCPSTGRRRRSGTGILALLLASLITVVSATLLTAPGTAAADPSPAPASSSQLITVNTASDAATTGTLSAWDRSTAGTWTRVFGPVQAWLGSRGSEQPVRADLVPRPAPSR